MPDLSFEELTARTGVSSISQEARSYAQQVLIAGGYQAAPQDSTQAELDAAVMQVAFYNPTAMYDGQHWLKVTDFVIPWLFRRTPDRMPSSIWCRVLLDFEQFQWADAHDFASCLELLADQPNCWSDTTKFLLRLRQTAHLRLLSECSQLDLSDFASCVLEIEGAFRNESDEDLLAFAKQLDSHKTIADVYCRLRADTDPYFRFDFNGWLAQELREHLEVACKI